MYYQYKITTDALACDKIMAVLDICVYFYQLHCDTVYVCVWC